MQNDDTTFIWTNQWRDKIARIPGLKSTPGGLSLGYYASTRIEMMMGEKETEERQVVRKGKWTAKKIPVGQWVNCTTRKDKTTSPLRMASFMLDHEHKGISRGREVLDLGMEDGIIDRRGDYYYFESPGGNEVRCHGVKNFLKRMENAPDEFVFLESCIIERTEELANG